MRITSILIWVASYRQNRFGPLTIPHEQNRFSCDCVSFTPPAVSLASPTHPSSAAGLTHSMAAQRAARLAHRPRPNTGTSSSQRRPALCSVQCQTPSSGAGWGGHTGRSGPATCQSRLTPGSGHAASQTAPHTRHRQRCRAPPLVTRRGGQLGTVRQINTQTRPAHCSPLSVTALRSPISAEIPLVHRSAFTAFERFTAFADPL